MESTASEYFGRRVAEYDSLIRRAVPRYDEMIERLVEYLPSSPRRILELGCGTGNLSLAVAERFPEAELTLVDAASEMLDIALRRLRARSGERPERFHAREARFEELGPSNPTSRSPGARFDLVTSCVSIHHVRDKASLFGALFELVEPGGALAFSDQMAGSTEAHSAINWNRWLEFCRAPEPCTEEEIASLIEHAHAHDHYTPVHEQMQQLEAAGFADVDCVWRNWMWGVVVGFRRR